MRFFKSTLIFFVTVFFYHVQTQAQAINDYVILKSGDTIRTTVLRQSNDFFFKVKDNDSLLKITPNNVSEFRFAKNRRPLTLKYLPGKENAVCLAVVEGGKINLFEVSSSFNTGGVFISGMAGSGMVGGGRGSDITYYIEKQGVDSVYLIKTSGIGTSNKQRKLLFESLIADDEELLNFYKLKDQFSYDVIQTTVKTYNRRNKRSH